jgi:hypothetical protein
LHRLDLLHHHKNESESFVFVHKDTLVIDIEEMFANELKEGKRLAVVFITKNGDPNEKILGLVTAWDVAGCRVNKNYS